MQPNPSSETLRERLLRDLSAITTLLDDPRMGGQVLERLPSGEYAWLRPQLDAAIRDADDVDDVDQVLTGAWAGPSPSLTVRSAARSPSAAAISSPAGVLSAGCSAARSRRHDHR